MVATNYNLFFFCFCFFLLPKGNVLLLLVFGLYLVSVGLNKFFPFFKVFFTAFLRKKGNVVNTLLTCFKRLMLFSVHNVKVRLMMIAWNSAISIDINKCVKVENVSLRSCHTSPRSTQLRINASLLIRFSPS